MAIGDFAVNIGCSGIESMLLFTCFFAALYALDYKKIRTLRYFSFFIAGFIGVSQHLQALPLIISRHQSLPGIRCRFIPHERGSSSSSITGSSKDGSIRDREGFPLNPEIAPDILG